MINFQFHIRIFLSLIILLILSNKITAQPEINMADFRNAEQETWRDKIISSQQKVIRNYFDVLFYDLNINIKIESPYISGKLNCRFKATEDNTQFIILDLQKSLHVDSIKGDGESFVVLDDSIKINLSKTLNTNEVGEVEVYYQGVPALAEGTKGLRYSSNISGDPIIASLSTPFLAHYWWPCKDGPSDKPDSVYINITIPDTTINGIPLIAVSNGSLENIVNENGFNTFQWRERYPIVPYYVMAAISNYKTFQQVFTTESGTSFPIDYYVFNDHLTDAQLGVEKMPEAMELFSNLFGEYPFKDEKYGMTQLGFYGAIENQTNTITNNMSLDWLSVSVHELSHMWFGDMITCKSWHHGWLNEGFATYSEALWAESQGGEEAYRSTVASFEYYNSGTLYLQDDSDPFNIFISIIYNKGAYVLHMLRGILGDEIFFNALKTYATDPDLVYGYAETEDFKNVCENISGRDLDYFFEQWIYNEGFPRYNYGWKSENINGNYEVELLIEQVQNMGPIFKMPIELGITYKDSTEEIITIWDSTQSQSFQFSFSKEPLDITLDPNNWVLKKVQQIFYDPPLDKGVLLVNGLDWSNEVIGSYEQKSYWGNYDISFWDLREASDSVYPVTLPTPLGKGEIGLSTLKNYSTLLWISGGKDYAMFNKNLMNSYLDTGGNIILMTNSGKNFLDENLISYLGIEWSAINLATLQDFISVQPGLSNIGLLSNQVFITTFKTDLTSSNSTLLYQSEIGTDEPLGVGAIAEPDGKGKFVFFACKPYQFNSSDLSSNIEYILGNFLNEPLTNVDDNKELKNDFLIKSIYPNPFNPSTTLEFYLPLTNQVKIEVYNILGEKVDVILNSMVNSGWHKYNWHPNSFSSGIYFIRITSGDYNFVQKAVLLK